MTTTEATKLQTPNPLDDLVEWAVGHRSTAFNEPNDADRLVWAYDTYLDAQRAAKRAQSLLEDAARGLSVARSRVTATRKTTNVDHLATEEAAVE